MRKFSERIGVKAAKSKIQIDSMDAPLRNSLWNALHITVLRELDGREWVDDTFWQFSLLKRVWSDFYKLRLDELDGYWTEERKEFRERFFAAKWYEVYDFVEFIAQNLPNNHPSEFTKLCNGYLAKELSGYRFITTNLTPVTNETELEAIDEAISRTEALPGVFSHLKEALAKLSDRESPDYRNSIKESISAVEGLCRLITDSPKATLGDALSQLKATGVELHPAIEGAWWKLYGYTSDKDGIRHALLEESTLTLADARYMLVSCSAFVSYLLDLTAESGISLGSDRDSS